jgi:hypothetical protein
MTRQQLDERWPLVEKHLDRVVRELNRRARGHECKVSRRRVLTSVGKTRSFLLTARALGLSTGTVSHLVWRASGIALKLEKQAA